MYSTIRFIAYEIESKVCFICRKDKIYKELPIKSWILIPENDLKKVENDRNLMIPEIFMQ